MRLWSVDPSYLDAKGLVALWREGLLARKVLEGNTKGYRNHPQLFRFTQASDPLASINYYLEMVAKEGTKRGYAFDLKKISLGGRPKKIRVTDGQAAHEMTHLKQKLFTRDPARLEAMEEKADSKIRLHPLFTLVKGRIEPWEKVTDNLKSFPYDLDFARTDFRKHPERYRVGVGEQGVLLVEPYKSELLPLWRFRTADIAETSAKTLFARFNRYKRQGDFVGMDMARKFLQMGYTRSRRYANHASGRKYTATGRVMPREKNAATNEKARSARIFYAYYTKAREDPTYKKKRQEWIKRYG